jgi:hypothetical protein
LWFWKAEVSSSLLSIPSVNTDKNNMVEEVPDGVFPDIPNNGPINVEDLVEATHVIQDRTIDVWDEEAVDQGRINIQADIAANNGFASGFQDEEVTSQADEVSSVTFSWVNLEDERDFEHALGTALFGDVGTKVDTAQDSDWEMVIVPPKHCSITVEDVIDNDVSILANTSAWSSTHTPMDLSSCCFAPAPWHAPPTHDLHSTSLPNVQETDHLIAIIEEILHPHCKNGTG